MTVEKMLDQSQCPWSNFEPGTIRFCEANLCSWISAPANTWSNLAYILVGLYVWREVRKDVSISQNTRSLGLIGPIAILIGVTSFLFHASFTFVMQVLDLSSMGLLSSLLLVLNLKRAGKLSQNKVVPFYLAINLIGVAMQIIFKGNIGIYLFALQICAALYFEFLLRNEKTNYRMYFWTLAVFALSYVFWLLDFHGIVCDPNNHFFQGHAVWHVINSICFFTLYRFYRQFVDS